MNLLALSGLPVFAANTLKASQSHGAAVAGTSPKNFTLAIIDQGGRLLLGEKKRGFGQGYINGFGGKVEPGETIEAAAARELQEEACITPIGMALAGILTFVFDDQPRPWEVHVFRVPEFSGVPAETEEMRPIWYGHEEVPFDNMWADDPYWYPQFLSGERFAGLFAFTDSTNMAWKLMLGEVECGEGSLPGAADWAACLIAEEIDTP